MTFHEIRFKNFFSVNSMGFSSQHIPKITVSVQGNYIVISLRHCSYLYFSGFLPFAIIRKKSRDTN